MVHLDLFANHGFAFDDLLGVVLISNCGNYGVRLFWVFSPMNLDTIFVAVEL